MAKPNISKVNPVLARQALIDANGDRKAAFSRYIILRLHISGSLG